MNISKEEFGLWKQDKVTKALVAHLDRAIADWSEYLSLSAGEDSIGDRWKVGAIAAMRQIKEIDFATLEGEEVDN